MKIHRKYHLTDKVLNYELILGKDIQHKLGMIIIFKRQTITLQEV